MQVDEKFNTNKIVKEILGTVLGAFVMATGVSLFLLPNQLSTGGISGIATILYYLFHIPMGISIILINVPLFLFSVFKIGKRFFVKSLIGTISLSVFIDLLDNFKPLTNDKFLACVYGGIVIGIGTAILFKLSSSTGGSDLISFIAKKYRPSMELGNTVIMIDTVIVILNIIFLKEIEIGLYSAIAIYLMGKVIDILFEGVHFTKLLFIISDKNEEISKMIEEKVKRGVTGIYGKGMFTNKDRLILMCAATRRDISKIKEISKEIDSNSFIIITNSREVVGLGFKEQNE